MLEGADNDEGDLPSPQPSPHGRGDALTTGTAGLPLHPHPLADAVTPSGKLAKASLLGEGWGEGLCASNDLEESVAGWLTYLGGERRYADNTLEAYERDARQFLGFLASSWQHTVSLAGLNSLTPGDFRNFMAARRDDGTGSRSLARTLSALRSLFRYLERTGRLQNRSVLSVALPKLPPRLPKPLTEVKAKDIVNEATLDGELSDHPWTGPRNQAVLLLLYGSGLRISEALGLNRKDAPLPPRRAPHHGQGRQGTADARAAHRANRDPGLY